MFGKKKKIEETKIHNFHEWLFVEKNEKRINCYLHGKYVDIEVFNELIKLDLIILEYECERMYYSGSQKDDIKIHYNRHHLCNNNNVSYEELFCDKSFDEVLNKIVIIDINEEKLAFYLSDSIDLVKRITLHSAIYEKRNEVKKILNKIIWKK